MEAPRKRDSEGGNQGGDFDGSALNPGVLYLAFALGSSP